MDFELTEEQRMMRETARKFAKQEMAPSLRENIRREEFDPAIIKRLVRGQPATERTI